MYVISINGNYLRYTMSDKIVEFDTKEDAQEFIDSRTPHYFPSNVTPEIVPAP